MESGAAAERFRASMYALEDRVAELTRERDEARRFVIRLLRFFGYMPLPGRGEDDEVRRYDQLASDLNEQDWLVNWDED